jgi:2-C-methyl-D-erythritol 4-phosphate cytidylyltransferase
MGLSETIGAGSVGVILPAAGKSLRFAQRDGDKKVFAPLAGQMVWEHAVATLRSCPEVGPMVIVIDRNDQTRWESECGEGLRKWQVSVVVGGDERSDSVLAGLDFLQPYACKWVAIHDAARPCLRRSDLPALWQAVADRGAAILARPVAATLKQVDRTGSIGRTVDRRGLWEALTPQVFRVDWLRDAYLRWRGRPVTDDAQLIERCGHRCGVVTGSSDNIKITTADDLVLAEAIVQRQRSRMGGE